MKKNIKNLDLDELKNFSLDCSQPKYRAEQIFTELYSKRVDDFSSMTTVPKNFRETLAHHFYIDSFSDFKTQQSKDGTIKFLFTLSDGNKIESVLIPDDRAKKRFTLCVSSQVGCTLNCTFCATGKLGFKRNLESAEIIDQFLFAEKISGQKISNIVFMGMGEPMYNLSNVIKATKTLSNPAVQMLSPKRITVSTVGVIKKMKELADSGLKVKLAVSLHATTDIIRRQLMPHAERVTISAIGDAIEYFYRKTKQPVTFEYIFLSGINNSEADAKRLIRFTKRVPSKVNIIPYHSISFIAGTSVNYKEPALGEIEMFANLLRNSGVNVFVRSSSGKDIDAACGQLAYSQRNS